MTETLPVETAARTAAAGDELKEEHSLASRLVGIAGYVAKLPRGEQAELRRLRQHAGAIPPEVFWRIVDRYEIHPGDEEFWKAILPLMVKYPHTRGARPGHMLEEAGVSAPRVERWLRMDRDGALREADRLFSRLQGGVDWVRLGHLLHRWDEEHRTGLARDFFLRRSRRTAQSTTRGGEG